MQHSHQNWFIGIRTPWTLESEEDWRRTHELAAKLFRVAAVVCLGGLVWPDYAMWFILPGVIGAGVIPAVYSYFIFPKKA